MKARKRKNIGLGVLIIILSVVGFWMFSQRDKEHDYTTKVEKWDNLYSGNNIKFYYIDSSVAEIATLKSKYKVETLVNENTSEIMKCVDINKWVDEKGEITLSDMDTNKGGEDLLKILMSGRKVSQKDYNTVLQELLSSIGIKVRIGEYRLNGNYSVLEVWDSKFNKWIMFDVVTGGYFKEGDEPLSAIEVLKKDLSQLKVSSNEDGVLDKKSIKLLNNYLGTYSIRIDNSKYEGSIINSYITYVKDVMDAQLETSKGYIPPTIFVDNDSLFNINPYEEKVNNELDKIPTIIFSKTNVKEDDDNYIKFALGAFMNSLMVEEFYVRVNSGDFIKVDTYYNLSIEKGVTTIEISLDGINPLRQVVIKK
ncbi:hypothetical protein [Clostridium sp. UBA7503]|uniref:hypothetical protein n=1 Tax=Clostridium sp. UBA7503 TaxID=1946377 RepID=UPI0032176446